jgi:hypothetical protein
MDRRSRSCSAAASVEASASASAPDPEWESGSASESAPEAGALGDALGAVGSSSVIVWQPPRTRAATAIPYANRFIKTSRLEFT